jgi:hypothetical protein
VSTTPVEDRQPRHLREAPKHLRSAPISKQELLNARDVLGIEYPPSERVNLCEKNPSAAGPRRAAREDGGGGVTTGWGPLSL